jgi:uncharacterized protein (DUF302 family)
VLDVTIVQSRYPFTETVGRLTQAIEDAGATLFANIDQTKAATSVGLTLRPTTLLVFGNPKAGTALMDAFPLSALDLPLKLLIWEDAHETSIAFTPMAIVAERYDVVGKNALLEAMDGALAAIVSSLTK